MDIVSFFGRFHPLVVHLPIGILLAAILIAFLSRKEKFRFLAPALDFLLLLGAISAALACILGLMLAQGGDYDSNSLFWHQWSGIFLAVLCFALYWFRTRWKKKTILLTNYSHSTFLVLLLLRSEEHTSELQSLMRISYAVSCLKKNKKRTTQTS